MESEVKKKNYSLKYSVDRGEFTKEQLRLEGAGGCDQLGLISVIGNFFNGDSLSMAFIGVKGNNFATQWNDDEWFEAFSMLAHNLKNSETLDPEKVAIAKEAFEKVRSIKLRDRS